MRHAILVLLLVASTATASNGSFDNGVNFTAGATTVTLYVRTTGSDTSGNGTSSAPYRTLLRALDDALKLSRLYVVVVDVTGLTETGPTFWTMPTVDSDAPLRINCSSCTGGALTARGPAHVVVTQLRGTSNAIGVQLRNGAQVEILGTSTDIAGSYGDVVVGSRAARSWTAIRSNSDGKGYNVECDYSTTTSDGSRLGQL